MDRLLSLSDEAGPDSRGPYILKLLGWLACARRSLRWHEIQAVMSVDTEEYSFDGRLRFVEDSKDLCASLVEAGSDGSITLVHSTTREYVDESFSNERWLTLEQIPYRERLCATS